jgi:CBS domain containing-hemolysin-like protein
VTTLLVGFLAEPGIADLLGSALIGVGLPQASSEPVAVGLALVLATAFSMVLGELVPKNLALANPAGVAGWVAQPLRVCADAVRPLIWLLNGSANTFLRRFGIAPKEELSGARTPPELASLVRRSAAAGTLGHRAAERVTRSLGFADRTAADVMTPRLRCVVVHRDDHAADVVRLARTTGHSRFPVIEAGVDDIVGVVHLKRAIAVPSDRRPEVPVAAVMSQILTVPETVGLESLLAQLRQEGMQLAVVVDEYGGTSGVVTLEDVVEEIVGEVADEHDRRRVSGQQMPDGSWLVPGLWRPDEVRDRLGLEIPDDGAYETIAGFVMAQMGRVPQVGDDVALGGGRLVVTRMDGRRVDRLRWAPGSADLLGQPERVRPA